MLIIFVCGTGLKIDMQSIAHLQITSYICQNLKIFVKTNLVNYTAYCCPEALKINISLN